MTYHASIAFSVAKLAAFMVAMACLGGCGADDRGRCNPPVLCVSREVLREPISPVRPPRCGDQNHAAVERAVTAFCEAPSVSWEHLDDFPGFAEIPDKTAFAFYALQRLLSDPQRPSLQYLMRTHQLFLYLDSFPPEAIPDREVSVLFAVLRVKPFPVLEPLAGWAKIIARKFEPFPKYDAALAEAIKDHSPQAMKQLAFAADDWEGVWRLEQCRKLANARATDIREKEPSLWRYVLVNTRYTDAAGAMVTGVSQVNDNPPGSITFLGGGIGGTRGDFTFKDIRLSTVSGRLRVSGELSLSEKGPGGYGLRESFKNLFEESDPFLIACFRLLDDAQGKTEWGFLYFLHPKPIP